MATNNLFNVPSWTSVQELFFRRLGIELDPGLVTFTHNPGGLNTASDMPFGIGDDVTQAFPLLINGVALSSYVSVSAIYRTDWQGKQTLSPAIRGNFLQGSDDFGNTATWPDSVGGVVHTRTNLGTAPSGETLWEITKGSPALGYLTPLTTNGANNNNGVRTFYIHVMKDTDQTRFPSINVTVQSQSLGDADIVVQLNTMTGATAVLYNANNRGSTEVLDLGTYWRWIIRISGITGTVANSITFNVASGSVFGQGDSGQTTGSVKVFSAQYGDDGSYIPGTDPTIYGNFVTDYTDTHNGTITLADVPLKNAVLSWDGSGNIPATVTISANATAPDGSKNPYHGSVTFPIDQLQVSNELPATLVWSDLFPMTVDALADYLFKNYGYYMDDGEFFVVGDPAATPLVRGGGEVYNGLNVQTRQFSLRATPGAVRWNAGSTILFQLATSNSSVSLDGFSITSGAPPAGVYATPYTYTYTVTGGTPPYNFSVLEGTSVAPINPSTGVMSSSSLSAAETFSWIVQVTDNIGRVVTRQEVVTVTAPALSMAPSTFNPLVFVGVPVNFSLGVAGGTPPYTYGVYLNSLPSTVGFQNGKIVGTFEGSLAQVQSSLVVGVQVTDSVGATVQRLFTFTINDRTAASIMSSLSSKVIHWYEYSSAVYAGAASIGVGSVLYDAVGHANMQVASLPGYDGSATIGSVAGLGSQGTLFALTGEAYAHTNTVAFNLPDDFAIMAVVNFASPGAAAGQALLSRGGDANGGYELQVGADNTSLALDLDMSGSVENVAFPTQFMTGTGNNYHVILQKFNNVPELVVNAGTAVDMSALTGTLLPNSTDALFMGAHPDLNASSIFKGGMGMVSLFSEKLWSDERKWVYNAGALRAFKELGYWPTATLTANQAIPATLLEGASMSLAFTVGGGSGVYVNPGVQSGSLPNGLSLSYDGNVTLTLSGTPTQSGTFSAIDIEMVSTDGQVAVYAMPTFDVVSVLTLSGTWPDGTVGAAYSEALAIAGGSGVYSNARVISGSLPAGLSMAIVGSTVVLSGTPSAAATSTVTVAVDSSDGQTANSAAQSIVISGAAATLAGMITNPAVSGLTLTQLNA